MKRTGSEIRSAQDDFGGGNEPPAEIMERARLQADVAQQRLRLAKDELRRARKRLKEAKREAKRTRRFAAATRKDWKRALRKAKRNGATENQEPKTSSATRRSKRRGKPAAGSTRLSVNRSPGKRGGRSRARAGK
jgi:hypothetical protein